MEMDESELCAFKKEMLKELVDAQNSEESELASYAVEMFLQN